MNLRRKCRIALSILAAMLLFILPLAGCEATYEGLSTEQAATSYENTGDADAADSYAGDTAGSTESKGGIDETDAYLDEDGSYTSKEDVMNYLVQYGKLPTNFITKKEAKKLGWTGGSLESYAPGKCIGGDYFGNYEEVLPVVSGRTYHECDIDTLHAKSRGAKRIVYSDDGQIYYTDDHYETFTLLYGDDAQ